MAVQGRGDQDFHAGVGGRDLIPDAGQVALHVQAQSQEVGKDNDAVCARGGEPGGSGFQGRVAELEESGENVGVPGFPGKVGGDGADGFVSGLDAGAVGEDDDAGGHEAVEM